MDIQKLIDDYATWLKQEITFEKVGEYYEITTPYLDSANDYLQIYVRQIGDDIYFTDDSATIRNLKMAGFQFTPARKSHLQRILNQYGVRLDGDELICKAPANSFAQKKHLFIQAMLRIDDMFAISKSKVASLFLDDIQEFFDQKEIFTQIMSSLQAFRDLPTTMTSYCNEQRPNQSVYAKQLITPINPVWGIYCLLGMILSLHEKMAVNLLLY